MRNITLLLIAIFMMLPLFGENIDKDIDYLGVTAILLRDGNYERAEETLMAIDIDDEELDLNRYYTLKGLIELRLQRYEESLKSFNTANMIGETNPVIYAYISQSYFAIKDYQSSIDAINKVPNIRLFPDLYGLKSQAFWLMGNKSEGFKIIEEGIVTFPEKITFRQQKVNYLIELDLTQAAMECANSIIELDKSDPELYLTLAESFRKGQEAKRAVILMEEAYLKFPDNHRILLMMAQCYVDMERYLTAAKLVEKVSLEDSKYLKDSAELYMEAGNIQRALYINYQVSDKDTKAKLRFNLLISMERFEEAVAIIPRLERTGLMEDESLIYAAAYVYFKVQKYKASIDYLSRIRGERLFRQASKLRKAIKVMENEDIPLL